MAIVLQQQKKKTNWFTIGIFISFLFLVLLSVYLLFFTGVPGIEVIAPTVLESAAKLSEEAKTFDPAVVTGHLFFQGAKKYGGLPSIGALGRNNPFVGF